MNEQRLLLDVKDLKKHFPIRRGVFKRTVGQVKAVDGVSFSIREGESLGMVGESGCGKTTTGRCVARLLTPTGGSIQFRSGGEMVDLAQLGRKELRPIRRQIQTVFQDPYSSLDSRMSIGDIVAEPLKIQEVGTVHERREMAKELLIKVGLSASQMERYPHEFSGGQRQRIGIARALTLNPKLLICDEPVSALDVSVQAQVLNLLSDLQKEFGLTYLFIAHDLSVVEHISDRIVVMYLGKVVEMAAKQAIFNAPKHPYTSALMAAIPVADPRSKRRRVSLEGTVPSPANPPSGCTFHTRCSYVQDICREKVPELRAFASDTGHVVACHFAAKLSLPGFAERTGKAGVS